MTFLLLPVTNLSLFPKTTKPLHISDFSLIQSIHESIKQDIPMAVSFVPLESQELSQVAGYAKPKIIETHEDGSIMVFVTGLGKTKLDYSTQTVESGIIYIDGDVIKEDFNLEESLKPKYMALSEALIRWIRQHIHDSQQREIFIKGLSGPQEVIGAFAAYLILDFDLQYEMMEIYSLSDQIKFLYRLLESGKLTNS